MTKRNHRIEASLFPDHRRIIHIGLTYSAVGILAPSLSASVIPASRSLENCDPCCRNVEFVAVASTEQWHMSLYGVIGSWSLRLIDSTFCQFSRNSQSRPIGGWAFDWACQFHCTANRISDIRAFQRTSRLLLSNSKWWSTLKNCCVSRID